MPYWIDGAATCVSVGAAPAGGTVAVTLIAMAGTARATATSTATIPWRVRPREVWP